MSDKNKQRRLKNYCEAKKIASNFFDFFSLDVIKMEQKRIDF